jgi:hypothetical protein
MVIAFPPESLIAFSGILIACYSMSLPECGTRGGTNGRAGQFAEIRSRIDQTDPTWNAEGRASSFVWGAALCGIE